MGQRGLVIIYDPHALMQFLEFYCMGDYEAEWDALCLPKEDGKEEMHSYCERAGVFQNIYRGELEYKNLPVRSKLKLFLSMAFYCLTGRRKKYCKKTFNQYVQNIYEYDIFAANIDTGFVSGMIASFGKEKTVIYFEDGIADYSVHRKRWQSHYKMISFENLQSVLVARLGYCGKGFTYLTQTKDTIKYCSAKHALTYTNYKEIRQFSMDDAALTKFKTLQSLVYPQLKEMNIDARTAVVFTDPVELDCEDWEEYVDKFINIICRKHDRILLKCHPRESVEKYSFPDSVHVEVVPRDIPAELILPYLNGNDCYFMFPDSIIIGMKPYNLNITIIYSEYVYNQINNKERIYDNMLDDAIKVIKHRCDKFVKGQYSIISI